VIGWSSRLCAAGYRFLAQPDWFLPQPDRLAATSANRVDRPVRFHRGNSDRDTRSLHGLQVPGRDHFVMLRHGASHRCAHIAS
jgi:hypothetical protein